METLALRQRGRGGGNERTEAWKTGSKLGRPLGFYSGREAPSLKMSSLFFVFCFIIFGALW